MAKPPSRTAANKGPINQSRAAGAPAPASRAATAPPTSFYDPAPVSQLGGAPEPQQAEPQLRAGFQKVFTEVTRSGSLPLERGGTVDRQIAEHMAAEEFTDDASLAAEIARIREFRKPIGNYAQKLALPKRNGYHRHWFNDTAGRVGEAEANGWTHIKDKDGHNISRCVGTGRDKGALYAFAMEIPEVFWLEDLAARNQAATDKVDALKASPFQSRAGEAKAADKGKFYDPSESTAGPLQVVKA